MVAPNKPTEEIPHSEVKERAPCRRSSQAKPRRDATRILAPFRHGDWIEITSRGTAIIYGRSDSTINRGGVRMGTAAIYRVVLASEEVVDALVVDVPRDGTDGWIVLFLVLREGTVLDPPLEAKLRRRVREDCSPRHVPDEIRQVPDVPRTLSGKILEVPVERILMGHSPEVAVSRDALANPHALDIFVELAASGRVGRSPVFHLAGQAVVVQFLPVTG